MYNLRITKEQAKIITEALDLFSRVGCGQFEELLRHPTWRKKIVYGSVDPDHRKEAEYAIRAAKLLITGYKDGASEGITVSDEHNRIAHDILQVIRHKLAWKENPEGDFRVDFNEPMQWADHPLAEISD